MHDAGGLTYIVCCADANHNGVCDDDEEPDDPGGPGDDDGDDPGGPDGPGDDDDGGGDDDNGDDDDNDNPNPNPCDDAEVGVDLRAWGMANPGGMGPHEDNPGGYVPVNRGFEQWYDTWKEQQPEGADLSPPKDPPADLYEDYDKSIHFVPDGDPDVRRGHVSVWGTGRRVPFSFDVPHYEMRVWIYYDRSPTDDTYEPEWIRARPGQTFSAGGRRPWNFPLRFEGRRQGTELQLTANARLPGCSEVAASDSVLLHVVDLAVHADADNDAGLDPDDPGFATVRDRYLEWKAQTFGGWWGLSDPLPGKLLAVNDADLGGGGTPGWADGFDADGIPRHPTLPHPGYPHDDASPDARFTPLRVTLPAWHHGTASFWFDYDAADPAYFDPADPSIRTDPYDMRRWGNEQDGYQFDPGRGSLRLWTKDGGERRDGRSVADGGDYVDSREPVTPEELARRLAAGHDNPYDDRVYYTHADLGVDPAQGGEVMLWVEAVRPSAGVGGGRVRVHAEYTYRAGDGDGGWHEYPAHGYRAVRETRFTAVKVDLDVDSLNKLGFAVPGPHNHGPTEEALEDNPRLPGKFLDVNARDLDGDGVIDWADFDGVDGLRFVPLRLTLPPSWFDLAGATIRFDYAASDPARVVRSGTGTPQDPYRYSLPDDARGANALRLWTKDGHQPRSVLGVGHVTNNNEEGSFVTAGVELPVGVVFKGRAREVTLWAEAVRPSETPGDLRVEVTLTLDSGNNRFAGDFQPPPDAVRMTAVPPIDFTPHRTGLKFGEAVDERIKRSLDPAGYVVLTNNDFEEGDPHGYRDYDNDWADTSGADDDLVRITLSGLPAMLDRGTLGIELSNPHAVRLFEEDGSLLWDAATGSRNTLALDLANPEGYLARLLDGDLDVWMEGLLPDSDFGFSVVFRGTSGTELRRDEVRMTIAEWTFVGADGRELHSLPPVWAEAVLAVTRRPASELDFIPDAYGKNLIRGLPSDRQAHLRVVSDAHPEDYYYDDLTYEGDAAHSALYGALYSSRNIYAAVEEGPLPSSTKEYIRDRLGLNLVHNSGQTTTMTTGNPNRPDDVHTRRVTLRKFVQIALVDDVVPAGGRIRGVVYAPAAAAQQQPWNFKVETSTGLSATGSGYSFVFDFPAGGAGDVTLSVAGGPLNMPGGGNPLVILRPHDNSTLIRVVPAAEGMSRWHRQAWEALRVDGIIDGHPVGRNRRITELYVEMYNSDPTVFKWAGMAAHASYLVGDAMAEAERWMMLVGNPPGVPDPKTGFELLAQGNLDVYMDLYPQLLAYREGGIEAVREMQAARVIDLAQLDAWEDIEQGRVQNDQQLIWAGNEQLLKFEQEVTLQNGVYAANPGYFFQLTNASLTNPQTGQVLMYLAPMPSPIPGDNSVFQSFRNEYADVPNNASIGHFPSRWAWITRKQLPAYKAWSDANQTIDVQRLLNGGYKKR